MPRKQPTTLEECNAELERTRKQLQQYENRNKIQKIFYKNYNRSLRVFPTAIFERFYILTPERKKLRIKNQRIGFIWSSRKKQSPCKS